MTRPIALLIGWTFVGLSVSHASEDPHGSLTIDRIAAIRHPSSATWSPDGARVAFLWDDAGNENLFVVEPGGAPRALTAFAPDPDDLTGDIETFSWVSSDQMIFLHDGALWKVSTDGALDRVDGFDDVTAFALSPDRTQVAITRRGQLEVSGIDGSALRSLTTLDDGLRAAAPVFSPDGERLAFTASVTERVADVLPYNGTKQALYRNVTTDRRVGVIGARGGTPTWFAIDGRVNHVQWVNATSVLFQHISSGHEDTRDRRGLRRRQHENAPGRSRPAVVVSHPTGRANGRLTGRGVRRVFFPTRAAGRTSTSSRPTRRTAPKRVSSRRAPTRQASEAGPRTANASRSTTTRGARWNASSG